ncbi:hypothetical protein R0135_00595 [Congregibacter variabilis]|uniref:Uncharacterized protein n=1 Tax=Congregibacter variabilis TaxID=3081200 RepID=A0ABZ0I2F9_9GAMM|nr:hypothetical protein R0135_00595 [Congregibacter sp. IMCC43200]
MNTYEFFNAHFGRHLVTQQGEPHEAAQRCLSSSHKLAKGTSGRLASGWAVVKAGRGTVQLKLATEGLEYSDITRYEAFAKELENWDGEPMMLLVFDKKPLSIDKLFITADLRAVRICTPAGVQSFDWTQPPGDSSPAYQRIMSSQLKKQNAA